MQDNSQKSTTISKKDRKREYPKTGDTIRLVIGRDGDIVHTGIYNVKSADKFTFTAELQDVVVEKETGYIPI